MIGTARACHILTHQLYHADTVIYMYTHIHVSMYLSVVTIACYLCTHNMIQTIMQCTQHVMKLCYLTCVGFETRQWSTPVLLQ